MISWLIWLPPFAPRFGITGLQVIPGYHHYIGSFGPMIAALIVNNYSGGSSGVKDLLKKILQWKVKWYWYWYWYAVVLALPFLLMLAAGWAGYYIYKETFSMTGFSTNPKFPQFGPLAYFLFNFFTFGIGEEAGWRGYALPALQKDSLLFLLR
jgi:membrane protease YdiL (CAAX protease family)